MQRIGKTFSLTNVMIGHLGRYIRLAILLVALIAGIYGTYVVVKADQQTVRLCFPNTGVGQNITGKKLGLDWQQFWAGVFNVKVDNTEQNAFCTDINNDIATGNCFDNVPVGATNSQVACTLQYYPPTNSISNAEAAARQAVVWHFADGFTLYSQDSVYDRYNEIITDITNKMSAGQCAVTQTPQITIDPSSAVNYLIPKNGGGYESSSHDFTVKVLKGTEVVANQSVTITTTLGTFSNGLNSITVTTDANGEAVVTLSYNAVGTATLKATTTLPMPAGTKLDPGTAIQKIVLSGTQNFTVEAQATKEWVPGSSIVVKKFHDKNRNGIFDNDEELINWQIKYKESTAPSSSYTSMYLGSDGTVTIPVNPTKKYTICEIQKSGWQRTLPASDDCYSNVAPGTTVWFGNVDLPMLLIKKFEDLNGNGLRDSSDINDPAYEPGIDGWSFIVYRLAGDGSWSQTYSGVTSAGGLLGFDNIEYNTYKIDEQPQATGGWLSSTSPSVQQIVDAYQIYTVEFGNLRPGVLQINKKWLQNSVEVSAPTGATASICIKRVAPGIPYTSLIPQNGAGADLNADAQGFYCQDVSTSAIWKNLWPGTYSIKEKSAPSGWTAQASIADVTVISGQVATAENAVTVRNNQQPGSLKVTKSIDWNGVTGKSESFEICLSGPSFAAGSTRTDACKAISQSGDLLWEDLIPGTYKVTESDPGSEWKITGSNVDVTVEGNKTSTHTVTNKYIQPGSLTVNKEWYANGAKVTAPTGGATICINPPDDLPSGWDVSTWGSPVVLDSQTWYCKTGVLDSVQWTNLWPGHYQAKEHGVPAGWVGSGIILETDIASGQGGSATIVPGPLSATIKLNDNKDTTIEISFVSLSADGKTWTYHVKEIKGRSLSHWDLQVCMSIVSGTPTGYSVGRDGSTGFYGIKWNTDDGFSEGDFSFTTDKVYPTGTLEVLAKAGTQFAVSTIKGPVCAEVPQPLTLKNYATGSISGMKWDDANADGSITAGETGVQGWTIQLFKKTDGTYSSSALATAITGADGSYQFTNLMAGDYKICEVSTGPTGWENYDQTYPTTASGCHEVTLGTGTEQSMVHNDISFGNVKLGSLEVTKSVDWNGVTPVAGISFSICIKGPSYPNGNEAGACKAFNGSETPTAWKQVWTNLIPGDYVVTETDPGSAWTVTGNGVTATVPDNGGSISKTVTNTRKLGSLEVTKSVVWNGADDNQSFSICIKGPSYPNGTETGACKNFDGSTTNPWAQSWTSLIPGEYTITETDPGTGWVVDYSNQVVYILDDGTLINAGENLITGVTVTNTWAPGELTIVKNAIFNGHEGQEFTICLYGPAINGVFNTDNGACKTFNGTETPTAWSQTWPNLVPGDYMVEEIDPGSGWVVEYSEQLVTVNVDGIVFNTETEAEVSEVTVTNTWAPGNISVKKIVDWKDVPHEGQDPSFEICLYRVVNQPVGIKGDLPGDPHTGSVQIGCVNLKHNQTAIWEDLTPGTYFIEEVDPGAAWHVEISSSQVVINTNIQQYTNLQAVKLLVNSTTDVTVTNTRLAGSLEVVKTVNFINVNPDYSQKFDICISGPSYPAPADGEAYPAGACQTVEYDTVLQDWTTLLWEHLIPGQYTVAETTVLGAGWAVPEIVYPDVNGEPGMDAVVIDAEKAIVDVLNQKKSEEPPTAVEIKDWSVVGGVDNATITWTTAWEKGTTKFNIYRSADASFANARVVGYELARGTANTGAAYQYVDQGLSAGTYYYWLVEETNAGSGDKFGPKSAVVGLASQTPAENKVYLPLTIKR